MFDTKRTKIVCTLGPATEDDDVLRDMMRAGMNVARLNLSHGDHDYHRKNIKRVRRIAEELGKHVAVMTDTKGPEIRTRLNEDHEPVYIASGDTVRVTTRNALTTSECIALDYKELPNEVGPGDVIYVDDGLIGLAVERVEGTEIVCTVTNGGVVGERKGVNVPHVYVGLPSVTDQDRKDIRFSCEMSVDAIAASFVRDADTVMEIRKLCEKYDAPKTVIFSKIESALALEHLEEIVAASDGVMVARGDLGVEINPADVPQTQKDIIRTCNNEYKPVITATQMLDSMTHSPRPTRAEVTDVANAIDDGTDCVMLSGETAIGEYPVEAVRMMAEVCLKTEQFLEERNEYHDRGGMRNVSGATGYAAVAAARLVGAKAILCPTLSGRTARIMSAFRPKLPIIATALTYETIRRTCFYWGVECLKAREQGSVTRICYDALRQAKLYKILKDEDIVVITAGDPLSSPMLHADEITSDISTNMFMIAQVM